MLLTLDAVSLGVWMQDAATGQRWQLASVSGGRRRARESGGQKGQLSTPRRIPGCGAESQMPDSEVMAGQSEPDLLNKVPAGLPGSTETHREWTVCCWNPCPGLPAPGDLPKPKANLGTPPVS